MGGMGTMGGMGRMDIEQIWGKKYPPAHAEG